MASSLAFKRLLSTNIVPTSSLRLIRPTASRLFNTNAVRQFDDDDDANERGIDVDRRRTLPRRRDDFFSDVWDPIWPGRNLSQVLNMMDRMMESPFRGIGGGLGRGWDARETEEALNLRVEMPGLDKEDVKVTVEQNTLIIKGEGGKESEDEESGRRYAGRIDLPEKIYRTDQIKAEMKNGVLKVVVPKVKENERNDTVQIKVE
ncbi:heat shock 22 kDa protein, mitochondrial isoform X2 [Ricinus communis]|uniref:Heat-shock protein, putative n=1 Tax=Ricinus communis TaxID=3988 RepID=B9R9S7_RICCO|nr:heat shock 22 kDa protein, mitochondrial isoform X2 [Ricinus communis]EEF51554.1 heat-shock protein, putative [Ricinus communis]|eukprot:XP_002510952.1 heat shock 22 kDa protein, mitochondrial [Ricinus communis]